MKYYSKVAALLIFLTGSILAGCEVEVEDEGSLPEVDVDADSGQMPKYEINQTQEGELPSVDVDAEGGSLPEIDVDTPDVEVEMVEKTIEVPDISVQMPGEDDDKETHN